MMLHFPGSAPEKSGSLPHLTYNSINVTAFASSLSLKLTIHRSQMPEHVPESDSQRFYHYNQLLRFATFYAHVHMKITEIFSASRLTTSTIDYRAKACS